MDSWLTVHELAVWCQGHALWRAPGVIITPHIGGAVMRMRQRGYALVTRQIQRYMAGEQLQNRVDF